MEVPIGQYGRLPPGESWQRAMDTVAARLAEGSKRRYRVRARKVAEGWWAYEVVKEPRDSRPVAAPPRTVAELAEGLPRCAQRAAERHGGGTKVAWPSQALAQRAADLTKGRTYRCKLPAPAIGDHWHHTTSKRRKR